MAMIRYQAVDTGCDPSTSPRHYKPTALRWYYHLALVATLAVLIFLTEYALRTLNLASGPSLGQRAPPAPPLGFHPRRFINTTNPTTTIPLTKTTITTTYVYLSGSFAAQTLTTYTTTGYLQIGSTTVTTVSPQTIDNTAIESGAYPPPGTNADITTEYHTTTGYIQIGSTTVATVSPQTTDNTATTTYTWTTQSGANADTATSTIERTAYLQTGFTSLTFTSSGAETDPIETTAVDDLPGAWLPSPPALPSPSVTVLVISQSTIGPSSTVTIERTGTDAAGQATVETYESIIAGKTSVFDSTVTVSGEWSESQQAIVIEQTVVGSPRIALVEQTTTGEDGQTVVQTHQTTLPGEISISRSTLSEKPGETLVLQPSVVQVTGGETTEVVETTLTDAQGHAFTSTYTTVTGAMISSSTIAVLVPTSVAPGGTLVTFQQVVATTVEGQTKVREITWTDADGHVASSSYTTVVGGTPTSRTVWTVKVTSALYGETLVTLPTVVPVTNGGTTEVIQSAFTDSQGVFHTSVYTTVMGGTTTSSTLWAVVATRIPTSRPTATESLTPSTSTGGDIGMGSPTSEPTVVVYGITWRQYVLGTFLPTVIAVLVSFPLRLIAINARLMQPFHALAVANEATGGSPADASVFLRFYSWSESFSFPRAIKLRQPIIAISDMLTLGASLLAPLAAEAIAVHTPDSCQSGCYGSLVASHVPIRTLEALMSLMIALLLALVILLSLRRWKTGVSCNPWSIAGMASLCLDPKLRTILRGLPGGLAAKIEDPAISKMLAGRAYALGEWGASKTPVSGPREYGVKALDQDEGAMKLLKDAESTQAGETHNTKMYSTQPFPLLTWWGRCIMLTVFSSVLIILVYYESTSADTGFERFMDSQGFVVKFFMTAVGVVLGYCMETVFRCQYTVSPICATCCGSCFAQLTICHRRRYYVNLHATLQTRDGRRSIHLAFTTHQYLLWRVFGDPPAASLPWRSVLGDTSRRAWPSRDALSRAVQQDGDVLDPATVHMAGCFDFGAHGADAGGLFLDQMATPSS